MLAVGRGRALGVGLLSGGFRKRELEEAGAFRVFADLAEMLLHIEDLSTRANDVYLTVLLSIDLRSTTRER
jgi:hypothetical protein